MIILCCRWPLYFYLLPYLAVSLEYFVIVICIAHMNVWYLYLSFLLVPLDSFIQNVGAVGAGRMAYLLPHLSTGWAVDQVGKTVV